MEVMGVVRILSLHSGTSDPKYICLHLALYEADKLAHEEAVQNGGVSALHYTQ